MFGCNANGDAISFLRESDGIEFIEAVKQLASLAGMEMPQNEPVDKEAAQRCRTALDLLEVAANFYQRQLDQPDGEMAREYLENRGSGRRDASGIHAWICAALWPVCQPS